MQMATDGGHGYRLFEKPARGPDEIALLTEAYEKTLKELRLVSRDDAMTQLVEA
jgi:hypothetical protein